MKNHIIAILSAYTVGTPIKWDGSVFKVTGYGLPHRVYVLGRGRDYSAITVL